MLQAVAVIVRPPAINFDDAVVADAVVVYVVSVGQQIIVEILTVRIGNKPVIDSV